VTDLRWNRWPVVLSLLTLAAAIVFLPAFLGAPRLNESFWIDWVWLDQFAKELGSGIAYPRWLPLSHHGLGSPVFYYYPPLAFYLGSLFVLTGLKTYSALLATFFAASVLSGVGAYLWLTGQSRSPLLGAAFYVIAPYHAFDFYMRGALAEYVAIALIPFVMLGLRLIVEGRKGGIAITAAAYAALICSHLPLALLASVFLVGPYAAWRGARAPRALLASSIALALGLLTAAIYLVPALALESYRSAADLWSNRLLQPANWTFWNADFLAGVYLVVLLTGAALAVPAVGLIVRDRSPWAAYAMLIVLLGIGLIPFLWTLPLLRSVQFPFRIFPLAEFGLATAIARAAWTPRKIVETSLPLFAVTCFVTVANAGPNPVSLAQLAAVYPDVPENLPPGDRPYSWPSTWALDVAREHRRPEVFNGITTEPVFYFPAWTVTCEGKSVQAFPAAGTQLLSYRGRDCTRSLRWTLVEEVAALLSLLGLIGIIAASAATRFGRKTQRAINSANFSRSMLPPETTHTIGPSSD
jgi:hypothetical protein